MPAGGRETGPSLGGRDRAVKTSVSRHCPGDTPLHRWCLLTRGSCGSTPGLLACGARVVLEARPASWHVGDPGRAAITVVHSCG